MKFRDIVNTARAMVNGQCWKPSHGSVLVSQVHHRAANVDRGFSDEDHLHAAATWLSQAQDVHSDGGVCGRYRLDGGWTSSYPETTGYIVPTFIALYKAFDEEQFQKRAERAVDFLLSVQLPNGAFPGGEIQANSDRPSPFNTGQIIHGLVSWHAHSRDERALCAARRAGDWLLSVQDEDGVWRKNCYADVPAT